MATIVVEAFVSASVEVLLEKIVSAEFVDFFRSTKLDVSLLEKLKITLVSLQAVLNDAEEKQITNPAVKQWLDMLRDAVFEADDLFDEINTEALQCQQVKAESQGRTASAKVWNILSSRFKQFYGLINSKMQILFERLEYLRKQKLGLKEGVSSSVWHGTPTSSVVDESSVFGRDSDTKKLKEFLLSEDASDGGIRIGVVSIVGMGGLGKTTLAKLLYNDPEVKDKFDLKGWAYISKDFDIANTTKTLLEAITSKTIDTDILHSLHVESAASKTIHNDILNSIHLQFVNSKRNDSNLNTLQVQLQQSLSHKKFLLILDDIWDGNYVDWNNLKDIFNAGEMGSKIIITTRDERVARAMQTFLPIHYLRPLESEDCWSLLAKHAFGASNYQQRSNLEEIGREIAKKCDGLPLAAIALGGLLRTKLSQDYWNDVLKSNIWELKDVGDMKPALLLSYRYLPTPLKGCFAYCSIFPKNSILEKRMVVQLWIAEGLVHEPKSQKSWEKVAEEYFDELVSRSLIQRCSVDGEANFELHDLANDLAAMVASPYCIRLDEHELHERVRHLSYNRGEYDSFNKFDKLYALKLKGLRTFLSLPLLERRKMKSSLADKVLCDLLPALKQLRVLSLSNYKSITMLPKSIGNLIYLRYLDLSGTGINSLPSVICKLYNLQTLLLSDCKGLTELPEDMGKLVNLRHLDISGTALREMPIQIARLENLQTLSHFVIGEEHNGFRVAELGKFPHLQGKLSISKLQNVTDPAYAAHVNLKTKEQIDELELNWNYHGSINTSGLSRSQSHVLEQLQPSTNLKNLSIKGYGGTSFPNWLGDSSFGNMVSLDIGGCEHCSLLPPLGQLHSLNKLFIYKMKSLKSVGSEFYGSSSLASFQPFPSLETLSFWEMPKWEVWKLIGGTTTEFPTLRYLSLKKCWKLKGKIPGNLPSLAELSLKKCSKLKGNIPENLPSLTTLELDGCPLLVESKHSNHDNYNNISVIRPSSDVLFIPLILPPPLNSLQKLTIEGFPSLRSFPRDGLPKSLKSLALIQCENLEFLPCESLNNYTSLEDLEICYSCYSMTSFTLGSLPVLTSLDISGSKNLESILIAEDASHQSLSYIRSIKISCCYALEFFLMVGLGFHIPNLIHLNLTACYKLQSLPEPINTFPSLQELTLAFLPCLQCFAKEGLPINLRKLTLGYVGGITECSLERPACISVLKNMSADTMLKALMEMEVPLLPTSLVSLHIFGLRDMESLDGKWLRHLTSLKYLRIQYGEKLKSLPKEGLPSSISMLAISDCSLLTARLGRKEGKEWHKVAHIPTIVIDGEMIT